MKFAEKIMKNKLKRLLNKIENNYKSFVWFVVELVFWTAILIWLLPLLAGMFLNTFKSANLTVSDFILFITAAFIIAYTYETQKQARATEKMAEYQIMPQVDVNMVYSKDHKKTYFWFCNYSTIPAIVELQLKTERKRHNINERNFYLSPKEPGRRTDITYDFWKQSPPPHGTEAELLITTRPAFDDFSAKLSFSKTYKFHGTRMRWDETTWGYPDRSFS